MKQHLKIFFTIVAAICGLNSSCNADTTFNYQIYIGKTLKLTEASFNPLRSTIPFLKLDSSNYSEIININVSHCTHVSGNRQLQLTDSTDHTILIWEFGDKAQKPAMSIPISEILTNAAISSYTSYKLYYYEQEHPVGRLLTSVIIGQTGIKEAGIKTTFQPGKTFKFYVIGAVIVLLLILLLRNRTAEIGLTS